MRGVVAWKLILLALSAIFVHSGVITLSESLAAATYTISDLGTLGDLEPEPWAINSAGQVVGILGGKHAFLWENGVMTDLNDLIDANSGWELLIAFDINDAGQIVGNGIFNNNHRAFLWQRGAVIDIGTLGRSDSQGLGINNIGQVVGESSTSTGPTHAFLWENGVMTDLGTLGGSDSTSLSRAFHINNIGQVVGDSFSTSGTTATRRAFLWENGVMTDLGTLGGSGSIALSINDAGQIVGFSSTLVGRSQDTHAFLWENGKMVDLNPLEPVTSWAMAINSIGQVVGFKSSRAFLWENGVMTDLNDLIDANSGWELLIAFDINDAGQIVGVGLLNGNSRAFLMTPVQAGEPDITWTMLPPSTITTDEPFTVAWSITGATTIDHVNIHWDPVDPTAITTCSSPTSCSTVSPTVSPATLIAPPVTEPTVLKYAVHARVDGVDHFSEVVSVTVNPPPNRQPPNPPVALAQFRSDGLTSLDVGQVINEHTVIFKALVSDPDGDPVKLQIELRRLDEFGGTFTGEPTQESEPVTSGSQAQIVAFGLVNSDYHWRARTIDATGAVSDWVGFGGNLETAADFIIDVPITGPDLAILAQDIKVYPSGNPGGIPVASEDATIEVTVQNVGDAPLPLAFYMVVITVWDVKDQGDLDTREAKQLGRAVLQADGFHVLLPALAPQETHTVKIPQDVLSTPRREGYLFLSTAYSDELQIDFLPPYVGALTLESNALNNTAVLRPFRPALGAKAALNCINELWTVASVGLLNGSPVAGGARDTFGALYRLGTASFNFSIEVQAAAQTDDPLEAFKAVGRVFGRYAKTIFSFAWGRFWSFNPIRFVWDPLRAVWNEWNNVGCGAVFPEAKVLVWGWFQGAWESLNSLVLLC